MKKQKKEIAARSKKMIDYFIDMGKRFLESFQGT